MVAAPVTALSELDGSYPSLKFREKQIRDYLSMRTTQSPTSLFSLVRRTWFPPEDRAPEAETSRIATHSVSIPSHATSRASKVCLRGSNVGRITATDLSIGEVRLKKI